MMMDNEIQHSPVGFSFQLQITGNGSGGHASFSEVSGLSAELRTEELAEGGEGRFKHKLPSATKYSNLVLKRGVLESPSLMAEWCRSALGADLSQEILVRNVTLTLMSENAEPVMAWEFRNAWPVAWKLSGPGSQEGFIAVETIEFAYSYFEQVRPGV